MFVRGRDLCDRDAVRFGSIVSTSYGAKCNWNGTTGTDDTAAFQAAATAASKLYSAHGSVASVLLPAGQSCAVGGTVTIGSGVLFEGPGTIVVPTQTGTTLYFQDADNAGVEGLTIKVLAGPGGNNAALADIGWLSASGDAAAHHHFVVRNNTISDGSWGIFVRYSQGTGSLEDVEISGNVVQSTASNEYTNADGIHVAGRVTGITINANRVLNRGDAAIALSSEGGTPSYIVSGALISNNVCLNDAVGLDNSGARDVIWSGNFVSASLTETGSNPAARAVTYVGLVPVNVKFIGNYLRNYQGPGAINVTAQVDTESAQATNLDWMGNTIVGPGAMWIGANSVNIHDNVFSPGSTVFINYDSTYLTQNIMIGKNYWLGAGSINATGNPDLYFNNTLAPQQANGTMTIAGQSNFKLVP